MVNLGNESLFGCGTHCSTCMCGCCCTPCLYGQNAKKIDGSNCFLHTLFYAVLTPCCVCAVPHYQKRKYLRRKYNLRAPPGYGDCLATCFCGPCALCQEARVLKDEGQLIIDQMRTNGPRTQQPRW